MDQEKHKAAMNALSDLIRSQLEGEERGRFASVKRLAVIGQKLMMELSPRPEDARLMRACGDEDMGMMEDFGIQRGLNLVGAGNDQQQMVREAMAVMGPAFSGLQGQNEARRRESVAGELNRLISARERLESRPMRSTDDTSNVTAIEKLTKRIDAILAAMGEEEKKEGDEDGLHMVPAVDVRRHQVGEIGRVIDAAHVDGAVPYGERRREGPLPEGDEAGQHPRGVGLYE